MGASLPSRAQRVEELLSATTVVVDVGVAAPVAYEEESYNHTAKVCKVSHAVAGGRECHEQLYASIDDDKPFCLDEHRQGEDELALLGIEHAEGEQYAVYGTRSAHCGPCVEEHGVGFHYEHGLRE